ncbi:MAG TPA: hypothetical protein VNW73_12320 [Ktedonobacteraceae bacterium]|nr:hypothetical protein [Ktedonobacteraceae bacterium]
MQFQNPSYFVKLHYRPKYASPHEKLIIIRRGEGGEERLGGPLWSPAGWGCASRTSPIHMFRQHPAGDHKGLCWRKTFLVEECQTSASYLMILDVVLPSLIA